jgi:hypothetical protein
VASKQRILTTGFQVNATHGHSIRGVLT